MEAGDAGRTSRPSTATFLASHAHGKSRVRVGRVWRVGSEHHMVEWNVNIMLLSNSDPSFLSTDNSTVVATDTMKNTVYAIAKQCTEKTSPEDFAVLLAKHFVNYYDIVTGVRLFIIEKPWQRVKLNGEEHDHGFQSGGAKHTVTLEMKKSGDYTMTSGVCDLELLKTTQPGFEGFIRDKFTLLPETNERIVASSVTANWKYSEKPASYAQAWTEIMETLQETFFGPARGGVYSPSVQFTLKEMGAAVLQRFPEVESVHLNMPNLHFIPVHLPSISVPFADDVYFPTSEPHGNIEATISRVDGNSSRRSRAGSSDSVAAPAAGLVSRL
eukprot:TRINITY_DN2038_c0_g1_i1.p1 TRINITY_DN2038_c0_g1~~TRINITY_DN2038_c0_g1_i1.p1  ORF type:complete len:339 (+),score=71.46 TRINITY_DN2038_c0_g1_i1:35-1018(+)